MTGLGFMAMVHGCCPKDSPKKRAGWVHPWGVRLIFFRQVMVVFRFFQACVAGNGAGLGSANDATNPINVDEMCTVGTWGSLVGLEGCYIGNLRNQKKQGSIPTMGPRVWDVTRGPSMDPP